MGILGWLRRWDTARRDGRYRAQMAEFEAAVAHLGPGDVAIDCGANVGKFTAILADSGATVHAFEPNGDAFAELAKLGPRYPNLVLHHAALAPAAGPVRLFRHRRASDDPVLRSVSSSVIADKPNVSTDDYETVDGVDIAAFVRGVDRVALLKMDVEGAEVALLNRLLDEGLHERIDRAFVEVHDRRIKSLRGPTAALRARLAALGLERFNLDWR